MSEQTHMQDFRSCECGRRIRPVNLGQFGTHWPWRCEECEQAEERRIEAERIRDRVAMLRKESNLPPEAVGWTFGRIEKTAVECPGYDALVACRAFQSHHPLGLYLWGPAGVGKTVLAWAILNREIQENQTKCFFLEVPELLGELRRGIDMAGWMMDKAKAATVLVLDDLGAEKPTEWVREQLFRVVNHRLNYRLPTIYTSNLNAGALYDHLGDKTGRLVDRIITARIVECKGESYRLKAKHG